MKMCEAFSKLNYDINLFVINNKDIKTINKIYNINNKFKIFSIFNKFILLNFILRIIFSLKILSKKLIKMLYLFREVLFLVYLQVFLKGK